VRRTGHQSSILLTLIGGLVKFVILMKYYFKSVFYEEKYSFKKIDIDLVDNKLYKFFWKLRMELYK